MLVALAVGVPLGASFYWWLEGDNSVLAGGSIAEAATHTVWSHSGAAALVATVLAVPVALLSDALSQSRRSRSSGWSTLLILAVPGFVVALTVGYFSETLRERLGYEACPCPFVYTMLFFPLALIGVRASAAYVPQRLEDRRCTRRWAVGGLLPGNRAADRSGLGDRLLPRLPGRGNQEPTATLLLLPAGSQTLATQFWAYEENLSYGQAAPYGLVMIAIVAVPAYVLARYFQRLPARATRLRK